MCIIHLTTLDLQTKSANIALKITVFFFVDVLMIALAAEIELNNEVTLLGDSQLGGFSAQFMTHDKHRLLSPSGHHQEGAVLAEETEDFGLKLVFITLVSSR